MNNDLLRIIYKRIAIISLLIIGISFFIFESPKPIVLGYVFGTLVSILNLRLLNLSIQRSVKLPAKRASLYATSQYFVRYTIYGVVLTVAAMADYLNIGATALGLLSVKIVIVGSSVFKKEL